MPTVFADGKAKVVEAVKAGSSNLLQIAVLGGAGLLVVGLVVTCWVNDKPMLGRIEMHGPKDISAHHPDAHLIGSVDKALPFGKHSHRENTYPLADHHGVSPTIPDYHPDVYARSVYMVPTHTHAGLRFKTMTNR
jgi:hypothetical protein